MHESSLFILNQTNSVANHFLSEIRSVHIQQDRLRFRKNLERVGELLAYELSKTLSYNPQEITTPLSTMQVPLLSQYPVLISILRAGIPLHMGVLNFFDHADNGFIGAFRQHDNDTSFDIALPYFTYPAIEGRHVLLIDPMLASGKTFVGAMQTLLQQGTPAMFHVVSAIAAPEGIAYLRQHCPVNFSLWVGAVDESLNDKSYIIPGLGDAGDLSFGPKM